MRNEEESKYQSFSISKDFNDIIEQRKKLESIYEDVHENEDEKYDKKNTSENTAENLQLNDDEDFFDAQDE